MHGVGQIANLDHLPSLRVLMLGKNLIEKIEGLSMLAPAPPHPCLYLP
jgi:hypothetical protein